MKANQLFFKYCVYFPIFWARGQNVPSYLRRLLQSQYLGPSALASLQMEKLQRVVAHAKRSVPFFGKTLANIPDNARLTHAHLRELLFITKSDLKGNPEAVIS